MCESCIVKIKKCNKKMRCLHHLCRTVINKMSRKSLNCIVKNAKNQQRRSETRYLTQTKHHEVV